MTLFNMQLCYECIRKKKGMNEQQLRSDSLMQMHSPETQIGRCNQQDMHNIPSQRLFSLYVKIKTKKNSSKSAAVFIRHVSFVTELYCFVLKHQTTRNLHSAQMASQNHSKQGINHRHENANSDKSTDQGRRHIFFLQYY